MTTLFTKESQSLKLSEQERRREDERRRTQEIKFTKEDMERVRLNMNGDYSKVPPSSRELDSQSRWVTGSLTG